MKKVVRLTESDIRRMVMNSVQKILNEDMGGHYVAANFGDNKWGIPDGYRGYLIDGVYRKNIKKSLDSKKYGTSDDEYYANLLKAKHIVKLLRVHEYCYGVDSNYNLYTTEDVNNPFANLRNCKLYGVLDAMPSSACILEKPNGEQIMFDRHGFVSSGRLMQLYNGLCLFATD